MVGKHGKRDTYLISPTDIVVNVIAVVTTDRFGSLHVLALSEFGISVPTLYYYYYKKKTFAFQS